MNRLEDIDALRGLEDALRKRGVTHAALFGSMARGDNRDDSDIDIMIDIDPDARVTLFDYVELEDYIVSLFDRRVETAIARI